MNLNPDFNDLLRTFADFEVKYLLIGAHALAVHARPRMTGDLDVWVDPDPANADRVYRALATFGAPLTGMTPADFLDVDTVYQIGVEPGRIDILTGISGVPDFNAAYARSLRAETDGLIIHVIGRDDFVTNKRASGREKDLLDVASVERIERLRGATKK